MQYIFNKYCRPEKWWSKCPFEKAASTASHCFRRPWRLCGRGFVLQLDNDPKHTYHMRKNYLRRKQEKVTRWSGCYGFSSSISGPKSYIENLWDHLKWEKLKHYPHSKDNLWDVFNQCWNNLKPAVLRTLVESKPGRVKPILKSKGVHTK
jgi:hypothetical protein